MARCCCRRSLSSAASSPRPRAVPASFRGRLARGAVPHVLAPTAVPWGGDSGMWHAPSSVEAVEDLCWNVDELQARADQPPLYELAAYDWRPPSKEQRSQMSVARRKRQPSGGESSDSSDYKGYGLTNDGGCPMHPSSSAAVILPVLKSIAAGDGASILRLGSSARLRGLLQQRTPHDLALLATGVSLSLGTLPLLPEHCVHVTQLGSPRDAFSAWPPWPPSESPPDVNLVACIQHCVDDDDRFDRNRKDNDNETDEQNGYRAGKSFGKSTVWLTSVQDLFDEVWRCDADAAEVCLS
jgi:hypothetical protein